MFYDEAETKKRLGITRDFKNWNSYSKHLYSNHVLAYDKEAIYLIDKFSITFETVYVSAHFAHLRRYANDFHFTYKLKDDIELRKESISNNYHFNYMIVVSGETFGNIHIQNTSHYTGVRIDISNQVLYSKQKMFILQTLYEIAVKLDLTYKNVSVFEIARDSAKNYYNEFCNIKYQSDFCPAQVHEIHKSTPNFSFYRKKLHVSHEVDAKNNSFGTARIGSNESDTQVKIYVKSNELKSWSEEKNYISAIHAKYFQNSPTVSRVEVRANSKAIRKHNWDLLDLLVPENHLSIFFTLLDDKLKFKNLKSEKWDTNRNKKFNVFSLIEMDELNGNGITSVPINHTHQLTHSDSTNKMKTMIYMYLDNELSWWGVLDFFRKNIWGKSVSYQKYNREIQKAVKNYRNPRSPQFIKKTKFIGKLMVSNGRIIPIVNCLVDMLL
jgi:hypothetical protein